MAATASVGDPTSTAPMELPLRRTGALTAVAWSAWALSLVLVAAYAVLAYLDRTVHIHLYGYLGAIPLSTFAFTSIGALVAARLPRNPMGWLFLAVGNILLLTSVAQLYAIRGLIVDPGSLPLPTFAGWLGSWFWGPGVSLTLAFVPLLFPDGRPPAGRFFAIFLRLAIAIVAVQAVVAAFVFLPPAGAQLNLSGQFNSVANDPKYLLFGLTYVAIVPVTMISVASLFVRRRRAGSDERQQLRILGFAGLVVVVGIFASAVGNTFGGPGGALYDVTSAIFVTTFLAIPLAVGVAILRYRVFDLDVVINRALVYGVVAALITVVYIAIVAGAGSLLHTAGGNSLPLSIIATAVVAVAFQPVRSRLQRVANRVVYGKQATPYEVLSSFSEGVAETYAGEEVLTRMARLLAEATDAVRAEVWFRVGGELRRGAAWPLASEDRAPAPIPVTGQVLPNMSVPAAIAVRHQGELLGALTVSKRRGEALKPVEVRLFEDLARQAGLVLRNAGLTETLRARLEELRSSRQRLVSAQDQERRRLERNLHDGAQQYLVALKINLGLLTNLVRDDARAVALAKQLTTDAGEALETMRDLARGIYPPLLADQGLPAALTAQARKSAVPVEVSEQGLGRYPQDIEAAIYFCVLEALQNAQKYAQPTLVSVSLTDRDGHVEFVVRDDGRGFDPAISGFGSGLQNMSDRIDALGGSLEVQSAPGAGTKVHGRVPRPPAERA